MDLQQRITRRLRADYDATRLNATVTIDAAAKLAALEAEDSDGHSQTRLRYEASARTPNGLRPLVLAEPDLQALTAAGLNLPTETDVQRPVTPAGEPAVVVGGRYVVGDNPTYRDYEGANDLPRSFAGETVTVTSGPDDDGDVLVENDQSGYWVDPRHLTPAPEPAAAPAVDDDLLRDIGELLFEHENRPRAGVGPGPSWQDHARKLLASEPMQSLRAAWAAEAVRSGDVVERAQYDHVLTEAKVVERERDEAYRQKTEWQATAGRLAAERDEARAEVTALRQEVNSNALQALGARAEVERLRATQQLPDAPSPESHVLALSQHIGRTSCVCTENGDVCPGHELLEDLAGMLTEAANTSSDDGGCDQAEVDLLRFELGDHVDEADACRAIRALDAHRARSGQEAGQ